MAKALPESAKALRAAREAKGISQEAAARKLGVSAQTVYRWEAGAPIKDRDLAALERLYGVSLGLDKTVEEPNGHGPPGRDLPIPALLRLPAVRARLNAIRAELLELGATLEQEESVMRTITDRELLSRFSGGPETTEQQILRAIDNIAETARRFLSGPTL